MTLRFHTPLTPDEQHAAGVATARTLALADKVRFAELDPLNHVNNKAYMGWFETLRVEHFHHFCRPHFRSLPQPRLVLRSAETRFIKEMRIGETYVATAQVTALRTASYTIEQEIWSGDLRATLTGVMVLLHPDGATRYPLPDTLREFMVSVEGAAPQS